MTLGVTVGVLVLVGVTVGVGVTQILSTQDSPVTINTLSLSTIPLLPQTFKVSLPKTVPLIDVPKQLV